MIIISDIDYLRFLEVLFSVLTSECSFWKSNSFLALSLSSKALGGMVTKLETSVADNFAVLFIELYSAKHAWFLIRRSCSPIISSSVSNYHQLQFYIVFTYQLVFIYFFLVLCLDKLFLHIKLRLKFHCTFTKFFWINLLSKLLSQFAITEAEAWDRNFLLAIKFLVIYFIDNFSNRVSFQGFFLRGQDNWLYYISFNTEKPFILS